LVCIMVYLGKTFPATLHLGSGPKTIGQAKVLRKKETEAEEILWQALRNRKCYGHKFRRQHALGKFVVDFYCHEKRLAIEVDGGIHEQADIAERDINRTFELERLGVIIIRFRNDDIFERLANVLREIGEVAKAL